MNVLGVWDKICALSFIFPLSRMESDCNFSFVFRGIYAWRPFHEQEGCDIREGMRNEARMALQVYASLCAVSSLFFMLALFCGGFYLSNFSGFCSHCSYPSRATASISSFCFLVIFFNVSHFLCFILRLSMI